jgi:A/G-specific adenine glycosylase
MATKKTGFQEKILSWYDANRRDLPWRKDKNPYHILLSEIILQQTRVAQGLSYYEKFVEAFPTVQDLAGAKEEQVLKLWQGLGYYSRARNLHSASRQIIHEFDGTIPSGSKELMKLKGVGTYTAAAVASIAFQEAVPVVDGNVYRVIARYLGLRDAIDTGPGQKVFARAAKDLLWTKDPGKYNQAIMEFGALQCVPANPVCAICPLAENCMAFQEGLVNELPRKEKKVKVRKRFFNYLVIKQKNEIVLQKRAGKDIWEGLYEFPLVESEEELQSFGQLMQLNQGAIPYESMTFKKNHRPKKHLLTHQELHPTFWELEWLGSKKDLKKAFPYGLVLTSSKAEGLPFPKIIENFWKKVSFYH